MFKQGLGLLLVALGGSLANSESILVPFGIVLIGAILLLTSRDEK